MSDGWKEAALILSVASALVSLASVLIARRALANSTRALGLQETKHGWEAEDRARRLAAEQSAAEERAWCIRVRDRLDDSPDESILVPDDKMDWARRGNGKFFQVVWHGNVMHIYSLAWHHGPLLG
jgi:hypothetical protein